MKKLIKFYFEHKKLCVIAMGILVAFVVFKNDDIALAADTVKAAPDPTLKDTMQGISQIGYVILQFASMLLWPVLVMIGSLLDNDLIFGGEMGSRLLGVWVEIRNIVNVVFVLILLAIAVYNVLGLGEEGGGLPLAFKTVLPKFVLALIAVNFSFLAVKVILDFTNVLTGAVFSLPARIETTDTLKSDFQTMICGPNNDQVPLKGLWCTTENKLNDKAEIMFSKLDRSNIAMAYAIQFGRAPNLKFVKDGLKDVSQLGFNIIFNTVLYVVYALSFIALLIVLLFRTVALWIGVVLSPLMALSIVLPNLKELAGGGGELKDTFVKNAIAPIKIGLVLSIGYIMLNGFAADKGIHGDILSTSALSSIDPNSLPTDITDLQQLMIAIGVIVIVWTGVFKAADETAAKTITGMIRDKAQSFGKWTAKLPMYAQIIPTGIKGREHVSAMELAATLEDIPGRTKGKYGRSLFEPPVDREGLSNLKNARSMREIGEAIGKSPGMLQSKEGFDLLRTQLIATPRNKYYNNEKAFDADFKSKDDLQKSGTLRKLFDGEGSQELKKGLGDKFDSAEKLAAAIAAGEAKAESKPVKDVKEAVDALKGDRTASELAEEKIFKDAGWAEKDIDTLKKLPREILTAILTIDDGKITRKTGATSDQQQAIKLFESLTEKTNLADAQKAISAATTLDIDQKKAIVKVSTLGQNVKDNEGLFTRQPPAATGGGAGGAAPAAPPAAGAAPPPTGAAGQPPATPGTTP